MLYNRQLTNIIKKTRKSILLLGPRQTGKSTLIQTLRPSLTINLADEKTFVDFLQDPGLIKSLVGKHKTIFVDEVQRLPSILNTIQSLIDNDKALRFFITGSSARKLKRGKANLLPGRILSYELGPLTLLELKEEFSLEKALMVGLLPGVYSEEDPTIAVKTLRSYSVTYLKEEIQAEALTKNLEGFSRFFSVATSRSGFLLDFTKLAKEASIERMSARRYFDILLDTLIAEEITPFAKSSKRRLIQHPKFYLFDVGVYNACLNNFSVSEDRVGVLLEHLVLQLISATAKTLDEPIRITTYRTESDAEVDFILERKKSVYAIEVKASRKISSSDLKGLKSFKEFYGKPHESIVIYRGSHTLLIDGIQVMPLQKALEVLFD